MFRYFWSGKFTRIVILIHQTVASLSFFGCYNWDHVLVLY